jgi:hypothetical protein
MAFTDEQVRAIVKTGEYSDKEAEDYVVAALIERRDKIGRAFFRQVLPLDRFAVAGGALVFEDLETRRGWAAARKYQVQWSNFDNSTDKKTPIPGATSFQIPQQTHEGGYLAADISLPDRKETVTVYLRRHASETKLVGIERTW